MKRSHRLYFAGAAACLCLVLGAILGDRTGVLVLPEALGGLLVGGGAALGALLLVNGIMDFYYTRNDKARREQEITEKDERVQAIRGRAAYRVLQASSAIYLVVWAILLALDVSLPALLVVCGGYVAGFVVYVWALVKYEKEL